MLLANALPLKLLLFFQINVTSTTGLTGMPQTTISTLWQWVLCLLSPIALGLAVDKVRMPSLGLAQALPQLLFKPLSFFLYYEPQSLQSYKLVKCDLKCIFCYEILTGNVLEFCTYDTAFCKDY
jgi:hypothetical protein